jgi:hypothetical protein
MSDSIATLESTVVESTDVVEEFGPDLDELANQAEESQVPTPESVSGVTFTDDAPNDGQVDAVQGEVQTSAPISVDKIAGMDAKALDKAADSIETRDLLKNVETWIGGSPIRKEWEHFISKVEKVAGEKVRAFERLELCYKARDLMVKQAQSDGEGFARAAFVLLCDRVLTYCTSVALKYVDTQKMLKTVAVMEIARSTFKDKECRIRSFPGTFPTKESGWVRGNVCFTTVHALAKLVSIEKGLGVDTYASIKLPGAEKLLRKCIEDLQSGALPCNESYVRKHVDDELAKLARAENERLRKNLSQEEIDALDQKDAWKIRKKMDAKVLKAIEALGIVAKECGWDVTRLQRELEDSRTIKAVGLTPSEIRQFVEKDPTVGPQFVQILAHRGIDRDGFDHIFTEARNHAPALAALAPMMSRADASELVKKLFAAKNQLAVRELKDEILRQAQAAQAAKVA